MIRTMADMHNQQRIHYEFEWDPDQELVRETYPGADADELIDFENSVRLFTVGDWFGTRGGEAEFCFLLKDENVIGIAETRDFQPVRSDAQRYPLWGNARVVPHSYPLYNQIEHILSTLRDF